MCLVNDLNLLDSLLNTGRRVNKLPDKIKVYKAVVFRQDGVYSPYKDAIIKAGWFRSNSDLVAPCKIDRRKIKRGIHCFLRPINPKYIKAQPVRVITCYAYKKDLIGASFVRGAVTDFKKNIQLVFRKLYIPPNTLKNLGGKQLAYSKSFKDAVLAL